MKKFCVSFVALFAIMFLMYSAASAQLKKPGFIAGGNVMYVSPRSTFANGYKGGAGGEVFAGVGLGKTYLVGTIGYAQIFAKSGEEGGKITYKPMKIGIRQFILGKQIFVNADVGTASMKNKVMSSAENRFTRGIGGGVRLAGMEGSIYYDGWKNKNRSGFSNSLQFKLGWNIAL